MVSALRRQLATFRNDRRGSITILSAVLLPVLIGILALVAEFGHGLLIRVQHQRVADLAAYSGALAYNASSSTTTMNAAIAKMATLNGLPTGAATGSLVTSPSGTGNQAVSVTVTTTKLLLLAPVLRTGSTLPVRSTATAELSAQSSPCIIALSGAGTGVTLSGGTAVSAPNCTVASNNTVTVPCGTTITTKTVDYNSAAAPSQPCNGIVPPSGTASTRIRRIATTDPLAGKSEITVPVARLATVAGYVAPAAPTVASPVGGTSIEFAWDPPATQAQAQAAGCTASWSAGSSTWTLNCPAGTRNFGNITMGGGIKLNFNTAGLATDVYNFSGSITTSSVTNFGPGTYNLAGNITASGTTTFAAANFNIAGSVTATGGTALTFGAGTFNIRQGLRTEGGSTTTFGAGTFSIGSSAASCNGAGSYSVCHLGTALTFGGPSSFTLAAGAYNSGGSTLTLGSGTSNSFDIGAGGAGGNALWMGGGAKTTFADALGGSSVFRMAGNVNVAAGGGSCLRIGAAAQHDIKGFFATSGGTRLGAGVYTVTGYIGLGANGGGDVTCDGATVGVIGDGVTLAIGGGSTPSSGSCQGRAFCVAAGYNTVTLTAPTTGTTAKVVVIGPNSTSNTAGAHFAEGAGSTSLSGAFYFPNGPVLLSGGASVGSGAGQCLELIGSQVSLTGGTAAASTCIGATGSSRAVVLIQ